MYKLDSAKRDALTAFLTRQLTAFDMRLNEPLSGQTEWPKVLTMRTNVGLGDQATAFFQTGVDGQRWHRHSWHLVGRTPCQRHDPDGRDRR